LSNGSGFTPANQRLFLKKVDLQEDEVHIMKTQSSNTQISLGKLAITLLVTALCSQLPFVAVFPAMLAMLTRGGGIMGVGPPPDSAIALAWFFGSSIIAIALLCAGPVFLSLFFNQSWSNLKNGIFVSIVLAICGGISLYVESHYRLNGISFAATGSVVIALLLVFNGKIKNNLDFLLLILAILIGLVISWQISLNFYRSPSMIEIPMSFLEIWLSAVFFPELFSRRTDWRGALMYILLIVVFTTIILKY
jgi:hypothetical protein